MTEWGEYWPKCIQRTSCFKSKASSKEKVKEVKQQK